MSTSKHIDKICCAALAFALILTVLFMNAAKFGVQAVSSDAVYASGLFDISGVHTIDIVMDDWDTFIANCTDEKYRDCTVIIDGETFHNVGIRAKGNTSLSSVAAYGNDRYSFKIEFDHYDTGVTYHGLDKLCLNNIIQDNTYMKDYLSYRLMYEFGVDAPLCSYSYITVNGSDWGLYLAVEAVEDAFLTRSYGSESGQLYKPDSMDMGGGRGNGDGFRFPPSEENDEMPEGPKPFRRDGDEPDSKMEQPGSFDRFTRKNKFDGEPGDHVMGGSDVLLSYTDDEFDSYANIFDNAKTKVTNADKTRLIDSLKKLGSNEDIEAVVNVDEVLRYFVVHNFVLNFDSYTGSMIHNYYLREEDGQLSMIPWDYNLAFGGFQSKDNAASLVNYPIDTPVSGGTIEDRPMLAWIFNNSEYTELYHQYFEAFITEYFDSGYFEEMIDSVTKLIAPYVESDPTKFCTYEEFEKGVSTLRRFCLLRAQSITGQLDGTIPATADGQAQSGSALIDASDITIEDMGTMGDMKGQGAPGRDAPSSEISLPSFVSPTH